MGLKRAGQLEPKSLKPPRGEGERGREHSKGKSKEGEARAWAPGGYEGQTFKQTTKPSYLAGSLLRELATPRGGTD